VSFGESNNNTINWLIIFFDTFGCLFLDLLLFIRFIFYIMIIYNNRVYDSLQEVVAKLL
jgi:hypothetical protein